MQFLESSNPSQFDSESLWAAREKSYRGWAICLMNHLADSMRWQFLGVSNGKEESETGAVIDTVSCAYMYCPLNLRVALTCRVAPDSSYPIDICVKNRCKSVPPDQLQASIVRMLIAAHERAGSGDPVLEELRSLTIA